MDNNEKELRIRAERYVPFFEQSESLAQERVSKYPQIAEYLYDICCGKLSSNEILQGYIRFYVAYHKTLKDVLDDLMLRTFSYRDYEMKAIIVSIQDALNDYIQNVKEG